MHRILCRNLLLITLQTHVYSLGNGFKTTSPSTAMDEFMKREFPDILNFSEKPHDVVFIPDTFQYGSAAKKVKTTQMRFYISTREWVLCTTFAMKIRFLPFSLALQQVCKILPNFDAKKELCPFQNDRLVFICMLWHVHLWWVLSGWMVSLP